MKYKSKESKEKKSDYWKEIESERVGVLQMLEEIMNVEDVESLT